MIIYLFTIFCVYFSGIINNYESLLPFMSLKTTKKYTLLPDKNYASGSIELHLYETHCGVATVRTMRMYEPNVHKLDRVSYT